MRTHNSLLSIKVNADSPGEIQLRLDAAVETARKNALGLGKHGILVTQHDFGNFSVALSPEVPFGLTLERRI
jgi:hypothetical protein